MKDKTHLVGWFTMCKGEGNTVSWRDLGKEYLEEMVVLKHGLENLMSDFGEREVVLYFVRAKRSHSMRTSMRRLSQSMSKRKATNC